MPTKLRDGSEVSDARLGRIPEFDERSKEFPIRKLLKADAIQTPRSYTWACDLTLDQGKLGSCVGNGFTHELAARPSPVAGLDEKFAVNKVYRPAQKLDDFPGENYEGTSVLAGAKAVTAMGYYDAYHWGFSFNDGLLAVGYYGPCVIGVNWHADMFDPDSNGIIHATGKVAGGHCLLWRGVNVKKKLALLHNSWGPGWGINGSVYISFDDLEKLLKDRGECCIPTGRHRTV